MLLCIGVQLGLAGLVDGYDGRPAQAGHLLLLLSRAPCLLDLLFTTAQLHTGNGDYYVKKRHNCDTHSIHSLLSTSMVGQLKVAFVHTWQKAFDTDNFNKFMKEMLNC